MMPRLRQALVEFENMEDAISCVQSCQVRHICYIVRKGIVMIEVLFATKFSVGGNEIRGMCRVKVQYLSASPICNVRRYGRSTFNAVEI